MKQEDDKKEMMIFAVETINWNCSMKFFRCLDLKPFSIFTF